MQTSSTATTRRSYVDCCALFPSVTADAAVLRQCLQQLNLPHGYVVHSGRENYSLGGGITALAAAEILSHPQTLL